MKVRDPVCGEEIDLTDAMASEDCDGWAYFFCSPNCRDTFNRSPKGYAWKPGVKPASTSPREPVNQGE